MATAMRATAMATSVKPFSSKPALSRPVARRASVVSKAGKTAVKGQSAMVCLDCGYIISEADFNAAPASYRCPVCRSPKRRFKASAGGAGKKNDAKSMAARMQRTEGDGELDEGDKSIFVIAAVAGAVGLGGLYFFLNSQM